MGGAIVVNHDIIHGLFEGLRHRCPGLNMYIPGLSTPEITIHSRGDTAYVVVDGTVVKVVTYSDDRQARAVIATIELFDPHCFDSLYQALADYFGVTWIDDT